MYAGVGGTAERPSANLTTADTWINSRKWRDKVGFAGSFKEGTVKFFDVVRRSDADGKSSLQGDDARRLPTIEQFSSEAVHLGNGQLPDITEYQAMPGVVKRRSVRRIKVHGIQSALKTGGIVERFAVCVRGLKLQSVREALFKQHLQRIVVGPSHGVFAENVGKHRNAIGRTLHAGQRLALRRRIFPETDQSNSIRADNAGRDYQSTAAGIVGQKQAAVWGTRNNRAGREEIGIVRRLRCSAWQVQ